MKRTGLVLALAMVAVVAFAGTALAALNPAPSPVPGDGTPDYLSPGSTEIYLPNPADPASYRIHSGYSKNTDACASCHATHTAVGPALLQWADVYETCMACHDGTVSTTYNVEAGLVGSTGARTSGGLFGVGTELGLSNHSVTGVEVTNAAPGGAMKGTAADDSYGAWTAEFTCASCHSPHGQGGNARILSPDPNGLALASKKAGFSLELNDVADPLTYVAKATGDDIGFRLGYKAGDVYTWIKGYPYSKYTAVYVGGVKQAGSAYTIDNSTGVTYIRFPSAPTGAVTADLVPAVRVTMGVSNYLQATEAVVYKSGLNAFCGACHSDYNTAVLSRYDPVKGTFNGSAVNLTGVYRDAYRHQVGYNWHPPGAPGLKFEPGYRVTCLTCHLAHGADEGYWAATLESPPTGDTWHELSGSSALKRKPNMATCEACHGKGSGNEGYAANTTP